MAIETIRTDRHVAPGARQRAYKVLRVAKVPVSYARVSEKLTDMGQWVIARYDTAVNRCYLAQQITLN